MKKHNFPQIVRLVYIAGLLALWSSAIVFWFLFQNSILLYLGTLLNVIIILIALWRPTTHIAWFCVLLNTLIYSGTAYFIIGINANFFFSSAVSAVIFVVSTILSTIFRNQANILIDQFDHRNLIIEALTINDRATNLMKWRYAKKALKAELLRSRRYHGELTVILFAIRRASSDDQDQIHQDEKKLAGIIKDVIRPDIDVAFKERRIGLILPERDLSFSKAFAYRIVPIIQDNINGQVSAGIANYPQDAENAQQILDRAEEALQVALFTDLHVFLYQSLAQEKEKEHLSFEFYSQIPQEITKPVSVDPSKSLHKIYEKILKNVKLEADEWIVWLKGFEEMEDLANLTHNPLTMEHIQQTEFLYVQPNYLVVRIKSTLSDLIKSGQPFPGWIINKVNLKKHYLMISPF